MRLSTHSRFHGEGARAFATLALPCAPRTAPSATNAHSPAMSRRHPLSGAATRTGEASILRFAPTTHARIAINEGATA
jgi:hypothetical protein